MSSFVGVGVQGLHYESVAESELTRQGVTGGAFLGAEVRLARGVLLGGAYRGNVS